MSSFTDIVVLIQDIPVENIINREFKSNFDTIKWFKVFYQANVKTKEYNAVEARNGRNILPFVASKELGKYNCTFLAVLINRTGFYDVFSFFFFSRP